MLACAALAAAWMVPTLGTLAAGMDRADSLWYHMPLAARFVQTGYLGHIYFFDPIFLASFYPANSEVVHALPILFFDRDSVSPLINLGWLAMALLAAWCIGRPYGLGPQALIGASVALGSQIAGRVPGRRGAQRHHRASRSSSRPSRCWSTATRPRPAAGTRDAARPRSPAAVIAPAALAVAGLAAGLAAGVKLSFLAPVAALTVAVIVIAPAAPRGCARRRSGAFRCWPRAATGTCATWSRSATRSPTWARSARSRFRPPFATSSCGPTSPSSTTGTTPTCGGTGSPPGCTSRSGPCGR